MTSRAIVRASVTYEPGRSEVRSFDHPRIPADAGLLKIEAAGVCGSDIGAHLQKGPPRILGHENVGLIEEIGEIASERWGVAAGDRVVVEEYLPCGHCDICRTTQFRFCKETDSRGGGIRFGSTGIDVVPSLWGGYSESLFLHPRSILHKAPPGVPAEYLTLALPVGNGYEWACGEGKAGPGKIVVIFGPGQQGLACVYAAKMAGADLVILFGLTSDSHRLEVGKALGADIVADVTQVDPVELVLGATNGKLVDVVIDTASGGRDTIYTSVKLLNQCGQLLLATAPDVVDGIPLKDAQWKCLSIRGVRGHSFGAVEWAINQIALDSSRLSIMNTHVFGLSEVDRAIFATSGKAVENAIHVSVVP